MSELTELEKYILSDIMVKEFNRSQREEITWQEGIKLMCQGLFVDIEYDDRFGMKVGKYTYGKNSYGEFAFYDEKSGKFSRNQFLDADDIMEAKWYKR